MSKKTETKWKVGDVVAWTSSANGGTKTKIGKITKLTLIRIYPTCAATAYGEYLPNGEMYKVGKAYSPRLSALREATETELKAVLL